MPEANVLYAVTAVVVAGLVVWVGAVLKSAKEPWARPGSTTTVEETKTLEPAKDDDEKDDKEEEKAEEKKEEKAEETKEEKKEAAPSSADATAEATPIVVEKKEEAKKEEAKKDDEKKDDEKKDEEKKA